MAWDANATLMGKQALNGSGSSTSLTGSWVKVNDIFPASSTTGSAFTPRSGTMLLNTGEYNPYRMGVVEFVFWVRGVTITGTPTNVQLTLDVEEADDSSGTNGRPVVRFRLGSTTYALVQTATDTTKRQFFAVGIIAKQYVRWAATLAITAGTNPTVSYTDAELKMRGMGADVEVRIPNE